MTKLGKKQGKIRRVADNDGLRVRLPQETMRRVAGSKGNLSDNK